MTKFFAFYMIMLFAFAVYLAYVGYIWFSTAVLVMSFICYGMLLGQHQKRAKDV